MFDSPLEESVPGQVLRYGLGYHGFVEFPALQSSTSCPGSTVKLTTYNGLTLYPFPASLIFQRRIGESAVLFRDPRAIDLPGDEEDAVGRDWRRHAVIQTNGIRTGAGQGEPTYNFALHTPTRNLLVNISLTVCQVTRTKVIARRSSPVSQENYPISGPSLGNSSLFADATPTGARALYCSPGNWLRQLVITGSYPAISPVSSDVVPQASADTSSESRTGTFAEDVANWRFGASAGVGMGGTYYVLVIDNLDQGGSDGRVFRLPYAGQTTTTRRRIVSGYFDGEQVAQLLREDVFTAARSHAVSWGVTNEIVNEDGATVSTSFSSSDTEDRSTSIALIQNGSPVTKFEIRTELRTDVSDIRNSSVGIFTNNENIQTINSEDDLQITLDGVNLLSGFAGEWAAIGGGGDGLFYFSDTSAPSGTQIQLQLNVGVYSYSMQLKCLRVEVIYTRRVSDVLVETRAAYFYGNACCRGAVDSGVYSPASGGTLYGSADPLTGEIRRNYPYPVTWC
jgi:hypothetical protein